MPCYLKICKKFLKQAKMAVCSLSVLVTKSARSDFQMAAKPPKTWYRKRQTSVCLEQFKLCFRLYEACVCKRLTLKYFR